MPQICHASFHPTGGYDAQFESSKLQTDVQKLMRLQQNDVG